METVGLKLPGLDDYFTLEAFNVLRTNIQFCGSGTKVIVITSSGENEGKTTVSVHLGRSLAELGKKVLVIDADMRKSVLVGRTTGAKNIKGLSEHLSGQAELSECIFGTSYNDLFIMFAGKYPPNPVSLLNDRMFDDLISTVSDSYDYVIVDTPPLGAVIDAAVVASKCDGAVLVIGSKKVKHAAAEEVVEQLKKSGCNVLGVVLNNVEVSHKKYY